MPFPAIREKFSLLNSKRKYLFLSLLILSVFLILVIAGEVFRYFYFGYHKTVLPPKGVRVQGWYKGGKMDAIVGTVAKKDGFLFTIENEGEKIEKEIQGKVFYCGERKSTESTGQECQMIDASQIQNGQFLLIENLDKWENDENFIQTFDSMMLVKVYD